MLGWRKLKTLTSPSLFSAAPLESLVRDNVTTELLTRIAAEHSRGRRLLVAVPRNSQRRTRGHPA